MGSLDLACGHWIFICKQKESLLEFNSSDWQHMELSCMYTSSACSWCALGAYGLKGTYFLKHKLVKCPYCYDWYLLGWTLKWLPHVWKPLHLEHLYLLSMRHVWDQIYPLVWWHLLLTGMAFVAGWS